MSRFVTFVLLVIVLIGAIGWYRGWFYAASDSSTHSADMTVTVDKDKIKADEQNAGQAARNLADDVKNKMTSPPTAPTTEPAP